MPIPFIPIIVAAGTAVAVGKLVKKSLMNQDDYFDKLRGLMGAPCFGAKTTMEVFEKTKRIMLNEREVKNAKDILDNFFLNDVDSKLFFKVKERVSFVCKNKTDDENQRLLQKIEERIINVCINTVLYLSFIDDEKRDNQIRKIIFSSRYNKKNIGTQAIAETWMELNDKIELACKETDEDKINAAVDDICELFREGFLLAEI